jgi:hypothetical protein
MICMQWFVFDNFLEIISDKQKWRGIHGGQIAPQQHSPLYLF